MNRKEVGKYVVYNFVDVNTASTYKLKEVEKNIFISIVNCRYMVSISLEKCIDCNILIVDNNNTLSFNHLIKSTLTLFSNKTKAYFINCDMSLVETDGVDIAIVDCFYGKPEVKCFDYIKPEVTSLTINEINKVILENPYITSLEINRAEQISLNCPNLNKLQLKCVKEVVINSDLILPKLTEICINASEFVDNYILLPKSVRKLLIFECNNAEILGETVKLDIQGEGLEELNIRHRHLNELNLIHSRRLKVLNICGGRLKRLPRLEELDNSTSFNNLGGYLVDLSVGLISPAEYKRLVDEEVGKIVKRNITVMYNPLEYPDGRLFNYEGGDIDDYLNEWKTHDSMSRKKSANK